MQLKKKMQKLTLEEFLEQGGATLVPVTNPWEVVRFKTSRGTHVVYANKQGNKTYSDDYAKEAYRAYIDDKPWIAKEKATRRSQRYLIEAIKVRDGICCFFCHHEFTEENPPTIEHLLSVASGGSNGIANLALAHEKCNMDAGSMSVMDKIRMREKSSRESG